jgi:hypothetical protein
MKWFDRWFQRKFEKAWEVFQNSDQDETEADAYVTSSVGNSVPSRRRNIVRQALGLHMNENLQSRGISFKIHSADGGYVVECTHYDDKRDEHSHSVYIINDEQDLGQRLAHIVTLQALKR